MDSFVPIPGKPGYRIDAKGRVESEHSGLILTVDKKGCVRLRHRDRQEAFYIGTLLSEAGFFVSGEKAEALARAEAELEDTKNRIVMLETEIAGLKETVVKGRRANQALIGIREHLNAEITKLRAASASGEKRGRPASKKNFVPAMDSGDVFDEWAGEL